MIFFLLYIFREQQNKQKKEAKLKNNVLLQNMHQTSQSFL